MITVTSSIQLGRVRVLPEEMQQLAAPLVRSIEQRIQSGLNASDQPARSLSPAYAKAKATAGARPIRDSRLTGATLAAFGVQTLADNTATLGFHDPRHEQIAELNNQREELFGISPHDIDAVDPQWILPRLIERIRTGGQ